MLFHTWPFLIFMVVVFGGHLALSRTRLWIPWLLVASYVFYGWWNPYYLALIFYSTALDYVVVALMDRCPATAGPVLPPEADHWMRRTLIGAAGVTLAAVATAVLGPGSLRALMAGVAVLAGFMAWGAFFRRRRTWLVVSLINNLSLLVFFKYADFFSGNVNLFLQWCGVGYRLPEAYTLMPFGLEYLLPVGISFYTFQSLSYTIDFYRGRIGREPSFVRFATFVSFFPQLVAGPIERSANLLPQLVRFPSFRWNNLTDGLSLFLVGLFKKLALANYLSFYVERVYERPGEFGGPALILATVAFAWQIFFDFSGYTDMARGVARVMGFELMQNFNHPYLATGLADFWSRWHISLSTWFRDYVYVPLGGNRRGRLFTYRNLFITLLISAVWHGAAWTFVIWGFLHAFGVMLTRELERSAWYRDRVPRYCKQVAVFAFVCFAWIFFRAESTQDAWIIVRGIFGAAWTDPQVPGLMLALAAAVWLYQWIGESSWRRLLEPAFVRVGLAVAMVIYLFLFSSEGGAFIYFQF